MPERQITPVTEILDFESQAIGFRELLRDDVNADIKLDFPDTVNLYSGEINTVLERFARAQEACKRGELQQYIIHGADRQAVGLARFRALGAKGTPPGVGASWANVSLFICHPYRGQGLGKLAMQTMLAAAREQFDGAWTSVRESNNASQKLVTGAGFTLLGRQTPKKQSEEARLVYSQSFFE